MTQNDDIITTIRDARGTKGLSQSELGTRVGIPQSHISKIETGTVDLKLSSLIEIARALDLELKLVPKKSLPAVESIVRSTSGFPRDRTGPALSEIKKLGRSLEKISTSLQSAKISLPFENIDRNLQSLKSVRFDTDAFVRLRKVLEPISQISEALIAANLAERIGKNLNPLAKELEKLDRATDQLSALRNKLVHPANILNKTPRPAYRFEENEDE